MQRLVVIIISRHLLFNPLLVYSNGPISSKRPYRLVAPGPPCSHMIQGVSETDLLVTGKYQKNVLELYSSSTVRKPEWLVVLRNSAGVTKDLLRASAVWFNFMKGVRRSADVAAAVGTTTNDVLKSWINHHILQNLSMKHNKVYFQLYELVRMLAVA